MGRSWLASPVSVGQRLASYHFLTSWKIADLGVLEKVDVVYVTLPGWKQSIASAKTVDDLPENCQKYIGFIEEFLGVPIEWIGVGPGRESMVKKEGKLLQ